MNSSGNGRNPRPQRPPQQREPQRRRQSPPASQSGGVNISYNTAALVICFILAAVNFKIFSMIITDNSSLEKKPVTSVQQSTEPTEEEKQALIKKDIEQNFTTINVTADDTKRGNLILVNAAHPYSFEAVPSAVQVQEPVTIPDSADASYWVKSNYDLLTPDALQHIDKLLFDFAAQSGNTDVMILDTYRSFDEQKAVLDSKIQLLGEEEGRKIATNPGESEHHTSLAIDLTLFEGTSRREYDGTGIYTWISDNCYKYGFVIRYPKDKTTVTGITYEPWHLRYVEKPHAYYMTKHGICLEEYITLLKNYTVDGERLTFTTDDGESYTVYSCPVSESGSVYVPKNGSYTLSGDNDGNIIVTCKN